MLYFNNLNTKRKIKVGILCVKTEFFHFANEIQKSPKIKFNEGWRILNCTLHIFLTFWHAGINYFPGKSLYYHFLSLVLCIHIWMLYFYSILLVIWKSSLNIYFYHSRIMKEILPVVLSLCQDVDFEVRGFMCRQLAIIAKGIG